MARKRKKKSKKSKKTEQSSNLGHRLPDSFWHQALGFILGVLIAPLLALAMFGLGGSLPMAMFDFARGSVGLAAYVLPFVFMYAGVQKFRSDTSRLPFVLTSAIFVFVIMLAGFFHSFVEPAESWEVAGEGGGGGVAGHIIANIMLRMVAGYVASFITIVLAAIALLFILKIPVSSVLGFFSIFFSRSPRLEGETAVEQSSSRSEKKREEESLKPSFTLNEGVPVQRQTGGGGGMRSLKNTAQKLSSEQSHEPLTTTSDPNWEFPKIDLLNKKQDQADAGDVKGNAEIIKSTLGEFNVNVEMEGANIGPRVTQYTLKPPSGVRLTKITALENNLALNLAATSIRIEAPIPGKRAVGIEVPNRKSATVRLHGVFDSPQWNGINSPLGFGIGRDIAGDAVVGALDKMPHLLIAGATGSGKSVMINTLMISLLYRNSPSDMKLILVDPKQVELTPYNDVPHLLTPVIVEPEKCISALKWATAEMERRYTLLAEASKRNIAEYNRIKKDEAMPYIVIVIDELADLMMLAARDVEALIVRLAQKARAVGIHLVLATQRPSVDVITGLIKANIPARIAFTVTSQVDSRTIIDQVGAEKLLGKGDMLFSTPEFPKPIRIQAALIEDDEVGKVTDHLRMQRPPEYDDEIITQQVQLGGKGGIVADLDTGSDDSMYQDAVRVVVEGGKASASLLQRRLRVGYARAARLIETMEEQGIIGPADGARPREVLISSLDDLGGEGE